MAVFFFFFILLLSLSHPGLNIVIKAEIIFFFSHFENQALQYLTVPILIKGNKSMSLRVF